MAVIHCCVCGEPKETLRPDITRFCSLECREKELELIRESKLGKKPCKWCREFKEYSEFPFRRSDSPGSGRLSICYNCMPFTMYWVNSQLPKCGDMEIKTLYKLVHREDGEPPDVVPDVDMSVQIFVPTCPLYDNCMARMELNLDPPCFAPDRIKLMQYLSFTEDERKLAHELFLFRFDADAQVVTDDLYNYMGYYASEE